MEFIAKNYKTVDTEDLTRELHRYIQDHDIIAYDVEATGINPRQDVIIGFSVSAKPGDGYYLPTKVYNPETDKLDKLYIDNAEADVVAKFLIQELVGKKLVMHNGVYDCEITKNYYGVSLIESLWVENMLLIHTVAEEGAFGFGAAFSLKSIAKWKQEEFKLDAEKDANEEQLALKESIKKNGGKTLRSNMEMYKADLDVLCTYGASDADLTIRSLYHFLPILKEEGLESLFFEEEVMPVYRNLTYVMETQGVKLDIPLLTRLREDIQKDITTYGEKVLSEIMKLPEAQNWVLATANEKFPYKIYEPEKQVYVIKNRGKHAQSAINRFFHLLGGECPLPKNPKKPDEWHATKGNVSKCLTDEHAALRSFLLDGDMSALEELEKSFFLKCSLELWKSSNGDVYVNIASKKQLGEIVFDYLREEPLKYTDKGAPQFNEEFISSIKDKYTWSSDLYIFNRLNKVSSYYERLWDKKEGDRMYFNFKQHGTVSGRYGSDAQQMPRPMEEGDDPEVVIKYSNEVRALMIPDEGYVFLDADYESLEPHCFAAVANDEGLKNIFRNEHDFYSTIAIDTEGLQGVSADKKADNFLKKIDPNTRQSAKAYCLGVPYGMRAYALSKLIDKTVKEAQILIDNYLNAYPELKRWMESTNKFVKENGYVKNMLGRIRHLGKVKAIATAFGDAVDKLYESGFRKELERTYGHEKVVEVYRDFKNGMNNAKNWQIQSLAASVVNRAGLGVVREANKNNLIIVPVAQIHDQWIFMTKQEYKEEAAQLVQRVMETETDIGIDLKAPPEIAMNWRDGH